MRTTVLVPVRLGRNVVDRFSSTRFITTITINCSHFIRGEPMTLIKLIDGLW